MPNMFDWLWLWQKMPPITTNLCILRAECLVFYDARIINTAVSSIRFEKPHSLSYHANTRTNRLPRTCVCVISAIDECGSVLKSIDTSGFSFMPKTPASAPCDASINAAFTSSTVTSRDATNLKSTADTLAVGHEWQTHQACQLIQARPDQLLSPHLLMLAPLIAQQERARRKSL